MKISSKINPLLVIAICAVAIPLLAQQSTDGNVVLHVFVPKTESAKAPKGRGRTIPPLSVDTQGEEPIFDKKGPNFSVEQEKPYGNLSPFGTTNRLDNRTDRVKNLNYFSNFTPSIIPYKRAVAQNEITFDGAYLFQVRSSPLTEIKMSNEAPGEIFWGSFLVSAEKASLHPLPSVSPDQKILEIRTEPEVDVHIFKDSAGNFSVKISEDSLVRINMKIAVPTFYFNGEFTDTTWSDFENDERSKLSAPTRKIALRVQKKIGLTRRESPLLNLHKMVNYFRNFQARPFPDELNTGDLYEQLALNQIGVCRHRSLAFMITASSLGIPTRYVYNEAHAFVEVLWPGGGWRRIDLGGAADVLNAASNNGRALHKAGEDTLPQPPEYLAEKKKMQTNLGSNPAGNGATDPSGTQSAEQSGELNGTHANEDVPALENARPDKQVLAPEDLRPLPDLRIIFANPSVARGGEVLVHATLKVEGVPLRNREITAYLGPAGQNKLSEAVKIGTTTTNANGRIKSYFSMPPQQDIGKWELFLYFKGDPTYGPALSD